MTSPYSVIKKGITFNSKGVGKVTSESRTIKLLFPTPTNGTSNSEASIVWLKNHTADISGSIKITAISTVKYAKRPILFDSSIKGSAFAEASLNLVKLFDADITASAEVEGVVYDANFSLSGADVSATADVDASFRKVRVSDTDVAGTSISENIDSIRIRGLDANIFGDSIVDATSTVSGTTTNYYYDDTVNWDDSVQWEESIGKSS